MIDEKIDSIYEEFRCELGIHERDIINAQNLHKQLFTKNPFKYESPFLISAVCVYAISQNIPQNITIEEIENISHIKKEDILKCYKMTLNSEIDPSIERTDDDVAV